MLLSFHRLWPDAPIYTLLYDEEFVKKNFPNARIKATFLQKFPKFIRKNKKYLLPFAAIAPETINLKDFDLVISSSSSFAKGIIVRPKTIHISYCHAPTRFLWDWHFEYLKESNLGIIKKIFAAIILHYLRIWDKAVADRVDYFIANSESTCKKIAKFYRANSSIIYPPVDTNPVKSDKVGILPEAKLFNRVNKQEKDYFLIVSRLSAYKKIDVAIEAFNKLGFPLLVVGEGGQKKYLQKISGKNIKFTGFVGKDKLPSYYRNARALIFPGEDDFGIVVAEAMAAGLPVIALKKGGAKEIITEAVTGEFFDYSVSPLIADAVVRFIENEKKYNRGIIAKSAEKYSRARFENEIRQYVNNAIGAANEQ